MIASRRHGRRARILVKLAHLATNEPDKVARLPLFTVSGATGKGTLTEYLQDLTDEWILDCVEAAGALNDPNLWFPGVNEGIEPVTDEHVRTVIVGMQRELDVELRGRGDSVLARFTSPSEQARPAVPYAKLPWRIQRALVERRRLRFTQWGIGRPQWLANEWSVWDVPDDAWQPRWTGGPHASM